jgi:hypothetical protein
MTLPSMSLPPCLPCRHSLVRETMEWQITSLAIIETYMPEGK